MYPRLSRYGVSVPSGIHPPKNSPENRCIPTLGIHRDTPAGSSVKAQVTALFRCIPRIPDTPGYTSHGVRVSHQPRPHRDAGGIRPDTPTPFRAGK